MGFSPIAGEHIAGLRNAGLLESATHKGVAGDPGGGPHVILWMIVEGDAIQEATYDTYGCPAAVTAASVTTQLLAGRSVTQALSMTAHDLLLILGGLPPGKEPCAELCASAIHNALEGDQIK